jgi:MoxR-like ATPase
VAPRKKIRRSYIERDFGGTTDIELFDWARANQHNILSYGETGTGKTAAVRHYVEKNGLELVTLPCNGAVDPSSVFVQPIFDEGVIRAIESRFVSVLREGGVAYLDEVNFMPARIGSALHSALDWRREVTIIELGNERFRLHDDCLIVASFNPDYIGTRPLNESFRNRFPVQLKYTYDPDIEIQLVSSPHLVQLATRLRDAKKNGIIETPVGTNALIEFDQLAKEFGILFAVSNFVSRFNEWEQDSVATLVSGLQPKLVEDYG